MSSCILKHGLIEVWTTVSKATEGNLTSVYKLSHFFSTSRARFLYFKSFLALICIFFGPENTAFQWDKYTVVIYLRKMFEKKEKDDKHIFRMTSDFNRIFVLVQGNAARLSNFAVTQISLPLTTKTERKLAERLAMVSLTNLTDPFFSPFFFFLLSPLHDWTRETGGTFCLEAVLASDQTADACAVPIFIWWYLQESAQACFSPSLFVRLNVENVATPKKGIFQEKELFRCCSPVVLLWQPDWLEACGGPAQRLYWLYRWL